MKKVLIGTVAASAAVILLAGCSGAADKPASDAPTDGAMRTITEGTLLVGTSPDFPPITYLEGDELVGADVETVREVGKRLGLKVEFEYQPWDQLVNSVQTDRIDVVVSSMTDTKEKQQTADFVDYFASGGQFYTTPEQAKEFTKETDICGASIALSTKTQYYTQLQAMSKQVCEDAGLEPVKFVGTDAGAAARLQLDQGRAQLAVQAKENLAYFEQEEPGKYEIVLDGLPEELIGMVVNKNNPGLTKALKQTLTEMYEDGTTAEIFKKHGLEGAIEPTINSAK